MQGIILKCYELKGPNEQGYMGIIRQKNLYRIGKETARQLRKQKSSNEDE